MDKNILDLRI